MSCFELVINKWIFSRPTKISTSCSCFQIWRQITVSILPAFYKIFEQVMYSRLTSYVEKHSILYNYQFGFRQKHSTNFALIL